MASNQETTVPQSGGDDIQVTTVRLPLDVYEWLRAESFKTRKPMNQIIIDILRAQMPEASKTA
jgi:hypothetical protein